jgi:uncharacterized protein
MKFQPERAEGVNVISRHEPQRVWVGTRAHAGSILVPWQGPVRDWPVAEAAGLGAEHFEAVAELRPELVIFGSGARLRFVRPAVLRPLIDRGVGVETMDTAAACRTYNVLAAEGRQVVAALIVEP